MPELKTKMDSTKLTTKIGLEIHVQLATKSKMFCRCNNEAFGAKPNTTVCPICLGFPGTLPVANKEAVLSTIKTGLILNCAIPKIAKFDRKHYFYPDLPKGYQISQYDEPFCVGGFVEMNGVKIRLNRIHLEEDAGKLIHSDGKSLVDLNRAGTPLMEIVTEPDIVSPEMAGDFLRKLQKIVCDVAQVSEASMEKGHLRCDANISVSDEIGFMSPIVELKNINSFRFVEKALTLEEARLKAEYPNWPKEKGKVTRGYDSKKNITFAQRTKEEAADYRYFPEPDLPPFDTTEFDLEKLKSEIVDDEETIVEKLVSTGIKIDTAKVLTGRKIKLSFYQALIKNSDDKDLNSFIALAIVNNRLGFDIENSDLEKSAQFLPAFLAAFSKRISQQDFVEIAKKIHYENISFDQAFSQISDSGGKIDLIQIVDKIIAQNPTEVSAFKAGKKQLLGFFVGQIMKESGGKADPAEASKALLEKLQK